MSSTTLEDPVKNQNEPRIAAARRSVRHSGLGAALGCVVVAAGASGAAAAEVTYERLANPEPQNWLMNHHDFGSHRFSALDIINKTNAKNLKLAFAVPLGGSSGNEYLEATPLVDDGFMYMTDVWSVVYKIDVRSGTAGRIVWKMDPGTQKPDRNRGVALWGNFVVSVTGLDGRVIATDKETGKIVWETNMTTDQPELRITAAPLALKDKIIVGASGGDSGVRDYVAALDAATGKLLWRKFTIPAPGEPGSETWKGNTNAWQTGGGAVWVTGTYDPATKLIFCSNGDGTTTIINQASADTYLVVQTLNTQVRAKTMALDINTHKIYLSVADLVTGTKDRVPGSFKVLVYQMNH
jgi:alcohol dehydrogenase (cytochrome c)